MPDRLIDIGGAAGGSGVIAYFASLLGFKKRMDRQEQNLEDLKKEVVYERNCTDRIKRIEDLIHTQTDIMKEIKVDLKEHIRQNGKQNI